MTPAAALTALLVLPAPAGPPLAAGLALLVALAIGVAGTRIVGPEAGRRLGWLRGGGPSAAPAGWVLVTMVTAGLVAVAATVVAGFAGPRAPLLGLLAGVSPALCYLDVRLHRLPDRIVLPALGAAVVLYVACSLAAGSFGAAAWTPPACGAASAGFFWLIHKIPRSGLGLGDAKFAGLVGLVAGLLGWPAAVAAVYLSLLTAGAAALLLVATRRRRMTDAIAYGPYLIAGCWLAILGAGLLGA